MKLEAGNVEEVMLQKRSMSFLLENISLKLPLHCGNLITFTESN